MYLGILWLGMKNGDLTKMQSDVDNRLDYINFKTFSSSLGESNISQVLLLKVNGKYFFLKKFLL